METAEALETHALSEAKNNCGLLTTDAGDGVYYHEFGSGNYFSNFGYRSPVYGRHAFRRMSVHRRSA